MSTTVETYTEIVGFHRWKDAPDAVSFLRSRHRHRFEIRCFFEVSALDREIEIFMKEREILSFLRETYGDEAEFGDMSCEMIASVLVDAFGCSSCEVLEDGKGGALVRK